MPNHLLSCRRFERRRSFSKWRVAGVHANEPILSHVPKYKRVDHARARNPESWWRFANCDSVFSINAPRAPLSSISISIPPLCVSYTSVRGSRVSSIIYLAILRNPFTELAKYVEIKWTLKKKRSLEWNSFSYLTSSSFIPLRFLFFLLSLLPNDSFQFLRKPKRERGTDFLKYR